MDKKDKEEFGKLPIHKYKKVSGNYEHGHYHVVVHKGQKIWVSVGLTSDKPDNDRNQKLHKVQESNGKIARLKRNATIDKKSTYTKEKANFVIDKLSEDKARKICKNNIKKIINEKKKSKK